jgi:hypothetical protein
MTIYGIYVSAQIGVRSPTTDTNITQTLTACVDSEIYAVLDLNEEYAIHHPSPGDEYTTLFYTDTFGNPQADADSGIGDISTLIGVPYPFFGSTGGFDANIVGTWNISDIFWNFDNRGAGHIYPNINIEVSDCNTTTTTTQAPTTTTTTTPSPSATTTTPSPSATTTTPSPSATTTTTTTTTTTSSPYAVHTSQPPPIIEPLIPASLESIFSTNSPRNITLVDPVYPLSSDVVLTTTTTTTSTTSTSTTTTTTTLSPILKCEPDCNKLGY